MPGEVFQILEDGIGRALVPGGIDLLLGRQDLHVLTELATEMSPRALQVDQQIVSLVLGHDADTANPGVNTIGQREIDDPVLATERRRRLGPRQGQLLEP